MLQALLFYAHLLIRSLNYNTVIRVKSKEAEHMLNFHSFTLTFSLKMRPTDSAFRETIETLQTRIIIEV
jgi:hypothetical protein